MKQNMFDTWAATTQKENMVRQPSIGSNSCADEAAAADDDDGLLLIFRLRQLCAFS